MTEHVNGRRIRGSQQDPHSRSHSAQEDTKHYGSEETAPSKTHLNKQVDEKLRNADAWWQLSCKARWNARAESAKPQGRGTPTAFRQQVQDKSDRHVVTLDEKEDQKIFQDDSPLQRMRRLILGERRRPGSITCWDTRNIKNTGAIGWQDRDDDLELGLRQPEKQRSCTS